MTFHTSNPCHISQIKSWFGATEPNAHIHTFVEFEPRHVRFHFHCHDYIMNFDFVVSFMFIAFRWYVIRVRRHCDENYIKVREKKNAISMECAVQCFCTHKIGTNNNTMQFLPYVMDSFISYALKKTVQFFFQSTHAKKKTQPF